MLKKVITATSLVTLAAVMSAQAANWQPSQYSLALTANYAPVKGFMQIPIGGTPGTSSSECQKLDEIGVNHSFFYDIDVAAKWPSFGLYGGYEYNRPSGSDRLTQDLETHGEHIPKNTEVDANTQFDWFKLGIDHDYYFQNKQWSVTPRLEADLVPFDYQIKAPSASVDTSRRFNAFTPRLGVNLAYAISHKTNVEFKAASSIPGLTNLDLITSSIRGNYTWSKSENIQSSFFAGVGITYMDFKDKQTMPNHIRLTMFPQVLVGVRISM